MMPCPKAGRLPRKYGCSRGGKIVAGAQVAHFGGVSMAQKKQPQKSPRNNPPPLPLTPHGRSLLILVEVVLIRPGGEKRSTVPRVALRYAVEHRNPSIARCISTGCRTPR
jgi:hypothetical protein